MKKFILLFSVILVSACTADVTYREVSYSCEVNEYTHTGKIDCQHKFYEYKD